MQFDLETFLSEVRHYVHVNFTYLSDEKNYGTIEDWRVPEEVLGGFKGDCDDFALACRSLLLKENINSRLIFCHTETGEGHLVLAIDDYIMDNRYKRLVSRRFLDNEGYKWIMCSGFNPGDEWRIITN